jgi:hypothetical protein
MTFAGLAVIALCACSDTVELPALRVSDRIVVGQLKSNETTGEVVAPDRVAQILQFANQQRHAKWSTFQFVHGRCNVLLTFMSGAETVGYIAVENEQFFTNGPGGIVSRKGTSEKARALLAMLPENLQPIPLKTSECNGV